MQYQKSPEEGGKLELKTVMWPHVDENQPPALLEEQLVLLTAKPSLQLSGFNFCFTYMFIYN